mmetsp:Transcript_83480/g.131919  ORF Transcript_83480/g.131919 Transcript_83480/m.131919 type:complete len:168 (+) Transcript_83480:70-573(+)|eukprot:CAMPEP_0169131822 /NCGR_PEP_ID=MMETSP1015-20121227/38461_1 /TAXON_ID=342587 /ORGANISM="Karlodinium micrum, Strain CCMP2283" /LENGTH=167 /DNA_ID=CAMNT_0009196127 /DNA_START=66 /DNA_END=569 /DNA_ORIENTATION=+
MALRRSLKIADKVPAVFVNFGMEQQFRFVSHPGVMAVAKLLEMRCVTQMRAHFTEENIAGVKKFDPELARKAQIAYDHKLPVNFCQLELIDDILPRLLNEKNQLEAAREEVTSLPAGSYELPKSLDLSAVRPQPGQQDFDGTRGEIAAVKYPELEEVWKRDSKQIKP